MLKAQDLRHSDNSMQAEDVCTSLGNWPSQNFTHFWSILAEVSSHILKTHLLFIAYILGFCWEQEGSSEQFYMA